MKKKSKVNRSYLDNSKKHIIYETVVAVEDMVKIEGNNNNKNNAFSSNSCNKKSIANEGYFADIENEVPVGTESPSNVENDQDYPLFIDFDKEMDSDDDHVGYLNDYDADFLKNLLEPETMIIEYEDPVEIGNDVEQVSVKDGYNRKENEYTLQNQNENLPRSMNETDHETRGYNQYPCDTCGKSFDKESKLRGHMNAHNRPQTCSICCQRVEGVGLLKEHIRTVHQKERPYHCQLCLGSFSMRTSLLIHMRSIHYQEKRFSCDLCGKRFAAKQKLRWHMLNHTGEKPYMCPCCNTRFSRKDHMSRHIKTKHPLEESLYDNSLQDVPVQSLHNGEIIPADI